MSTALHWFAVPKQSPYGTSSRPLTTSAHHSGYIGSDNENVEFLQHGYQGFADNTTDAASMALSAGVDQVLGLS